MKNKKRLIVNGILGLFLLMTHVACQTGVQNKVNDQLVPLPPHSVRLEGYLDDYIQLSIDNWNNGMHVCTWIPRKQHDYNNH
ncbi:MAG TPA: hypothetical protein GXX67_11550 [Petrimonas sp.]|jgi:hypothetical protein|nr:hypothetical protein [Petrimonas sp.]